MTDSKDEDGLKFIKTKEFDIVVRTLQGHRTIYVNGEQLSAELVIAYGLLPAFDIVFSENPYPPSSEETTLLDMIFLCAMNDDRYPARDPQWVIEVGTRDFRCFYSDRMTVVTQPGGIVSVNGVQVFDKTKPPSDALLRRLTANEFTDNEVRRIIHDFIPILRYAQIQLGWVGDMLSPRIVARHYRIPSARKNGIRMIRTRNMLAFVLCVNGKRIFYLNGCQIPDHVVKANYLLEAFDTAIPLAKEGRLLDLLFRRVIDIGAANLSLNTGTVVLGSGGTLWYGFHDLVLVTRRSSGQVSVNGFDIPHDVIQNSEFEQRRKNCEADMKAFTDYAVQLRGDTGWTEQFAASVGIYE